MLYSEKYKLLFVAVPKTGTTSFTRALSGVLKARRNVVTINEQEFLCGEHDSIAQIAAKIGWDEVYKMTVVCAARNPWDRLVSSYHFYKNGRVSALVMQGKRRNPKAILNVVAAKLLPFSIWLWLYRTKSCYSYMVNEANEMQADFVMRMEELSEDVDKLCHDLGISGVQLSHENMSKRDKYRTYYKKSTRKLVERRFKDDIKTFNYTF